LDYFDQSWLLFSTLAFAVAWFYVMTDNGDDDEGGGGMLEPVYQGTER